ncbi:hypothetical protein K439DRAFT_1620080 [Ramaria rubella]|nr:hypothetical protein K439DRAFT_1620080 [Ramaria rubella]
MPKASKKTSRRVTGSVVRYHNDGTASVARGTSSGLKLATGCEQTTVRRLFMKVCERQILRDLHKNDDRMDWEVMDGVSGEMGEDGGLVDDLDGWVDETYNMEAVSRLTEEIYQVTGHRRRIDTRNRRDRVHRRNLAWRIQLPTLIQSFMEWDYQGAPSISNEGECEWHPVLPVYDMLEYTQLKLPCRPSEGFTVTLARHGYLASSPDHPETAFSFHLLRYFKTLSTRCPHLSAQAFVKSICELHSVFYRPGLCNKFSDAYDIYIAICANVQGRVSHALGRDGPDWRLKNGCPACTYKLDGEPPLIISMQVTMDGNNTQNRMERTHRETNEAGELISTTNIERRDEREVHGDYYLSPEEVDKFANEVKRRLPPANATADEICRLASLCLDGRPVDGAEEVTPCIEKWTNLSEEAVKKIGELVKYPLAVMNKLIDVFGPDLMCGYDIGCGFSTTANNSKLLGDKIRQNHVCFCCGSFHGHAHCRLCQLDWHPLYIHGSGLEEYEGCEHAFSDSNGGHDQYQELSQFLLNNYRQACKNLAVLPDQLEAAKRALSIPSDTVFEEWQLAKKAYLRGLKKEPETDILKLEYLSTLIKLHKAEADFSQITHEWQLVPVEELQLHDYYHHAERSTCNLKMGRTQALELLLTLRQALLDLERKLEIQKTWTPDSEEWKTTERYLNMRTYQRALDTLEGLVVARLFELTKVNQSGTGYKLRMHIAKAMKARSQAIRTAIKRYNEAPTALHPPRPILDPQTVLDYVFLAEFDLLCDARDDDEYDTFQHVLCTLRTTDLLMAHQVRKLSKERLLVNEEHLHVLTQLESMPGYSGVRGAGTHFGSVHGGSSGPTPGEIPREASEEDEVDDEDPEAAHEQTVDALECTIDAFNVFNE